jgi:hypothetical protein
MFSIYCAVLNIFVVSEHVAGVINYFADHLSRYLELQESWVREDIEEGLKSRIISRGEISREFFKDCVTKPCRTPLRSLLTVVESLLETVGIASA